MKTIEHTLRDHHPEWSVVHRCADGETYLLRKNGDENDRPQGRDVFVTARYAPGAGENDIWFYEQSNEGNHCDQWSMIESLVAELEQARTTNA